ncbi:MAG TPA: MATE family efflux transporter [Thermoanaerobaculia bacterium]|nr:MATE family efflux transporter [Thermoanaerobaculia bacterium]
MRSAALRQEFRQLFTLALPLAAAQAGTQLMSVVDIAVLGRVGGRELAAAGLGNAVFFAVSIFGLGLVFGIDPMVSQAIGAGDQRRARFVMWQGVWLAVIVSAVLTLPLLCGPLVLRAIGVQRDLIPPGTTYLLIRTTGLAPWLIFLALRAYLQAHHVTRPMVMAMVIGNIYNLAADIVLVFGGGVLPAWFGPLRAIPPLGVAGAAIATVTGQVLQLGIVVAGVRAVALPAGAAVSRKPAKRELATAYRIGWPVAMQMTAEVGIFALVALLAGRLGMLDLAAHQVVISLAAFTFTVSLGVAAAGSVRVGRAVGARDQAATRLAGYAAFAGGALVMSAGAFLFIGFPRPLARLLTSDPAVIAVAVPLFFVAGVFQLSDGLQAVGAGVLRGAADTKFAFLANVIGHWLVGFPIALLLGFRMKMGILGLWWGFVAGLTVVAALLLIRFHRLAARPIVPIEALDPRPVMTIDS